MQSAKCKVQNAKRLFLVPTLRVGARVIPILHFAFCILHLAFFFFSSAALADNKNGGAP